MNAYEDSPDQQPDRNELGEMSNIVADEMESESLKDSTLRELNGLFNDTPPNHVHLIHAGAAAIIERLLDRVKQLHDSNSKLKQLLGTRIEQSYREKGEKTQALERARKAEFRQEVLEDYIGELLGRMESEPEETYNESYLNTPLEELRTYPQSGSKDEEEEDDRVRVAINAMDYYRDVFQMQRDIIDKLRDEVRKQESMMKEMR